MRDDAIMKRLDGIETELREIKSLLLGRELSIASRNENIGKEELISAKEVARLLQCSLQAVYTKCANGELPHMKFGKSYKFKKSEILDWVKKEGPASTTAIDDYVDTYLQKHPLKG